MSESWSVVDAYLNGVLIPPDPIAEGTLVANRAAGLPAIDVSPNQGRLLQLLVRMSGARRVLEIGTLGGYSTLWMRRGAAGRWDDHNVVRAGNVADPDAADADTRGTRELLEALGANPRLEATALQTVGGKGWDGFALAVVR